VSAFGDGHPDRYPSYGPPASFDPASESGYGSGYGYPDDDQDDDHVPQHRRGPRLLLAIGVGVVALLVVGAAAFGGSLLLSHSSPSSSSVAGAASSEDPGGSVGDAAAGLPGGTPSATEAAAPSATPGKPSSAPPTKGAQTTPPAKPKTTGAAVSGNTAYEAQVLTIVNTERAKAGCKPLAYNAKLTTAARKHSADMAARNYFSHDTPDGVAFATRITNEGYKWSGAAENIAKGQRTPADVMNAWMNSSGHRANILNCGLKDLGVGLAYQGKTPIWTQDFGSPR
jgi:uncharacterized protein YkwD